MRKKGVCPAVLHLDLAFVLRLMHRRLDLGASWGRRRKDWSFCLSKREVESLRHRAHEMNLHSFEHVRLQVAHHVRLIVCRQGSPRGFQLKS